VLSRSLVLTSPFRGDAVQASLAKEDGWHLQARSSTSEPHAAMCGVPGSRGVAGARTQAVPPGNFAKIHT
jgi:hypothetical protein